MKFTNSTLVILLTINTCAQKKVPAIEKGINQGLELMPAKN